LLAKLREDAVGKWAEPLSPAGSIRRRFLRRREFLKLGGAAALTRLHGRIRGMPASSAGWLPAGQGAVPSQVAATGSHKLTYHFDAARTGYVPGSRGPSTADLAKWHKYQTVNLGSAVRGAPLYLDAWQVQKGSAQGQTHNLLYVVASDNTVAAFDTDQLRSASTPLWSKRLGTAYSGDSGANIPGPNGIDGTPVLDPDRRRLYIISQQAAGGGNAAYQVYALDVDSGDVVSNAPLQFAGGNGRPSFDPNVEDQRTALALAAGRLYGTFAAFLHDDRGLYRGWIVSINPDNLSDQRWFPTILRTRGGGVWGQGGVAFAPDNTFYFATGNAFAIGNEGVSLGFAGEDDYWNKLGDLKPADYGDFLQAIVRMGTGQQDLQVLDWYSPSNARDQNANDRDLGTSPMLLPEIGGKELLITTGKDGSGYVLDRLHLGGWGGELQKVGVSNDWSMTAPTYFRSAAAEHYVILGGAGKPGLQGFKVVATGDGVVLVNAWAMGDGNVPFGLFPGMPELAGADDTATLWIADGADDVSQPTLYAVNAIDGKQVWSSAQSPADALPRTPHFPVVTYAARSIYVGTMTGFVCYGVTG